jgi:prepilin-type N-terminal cleavage/methylation domain-containing protein/prepilin-type processing-associated H-X9-DG protein
MKKWRGGYTFTEMLVVITIIGVLVALLLPAVQAAREAARRMNCTKNIEQLILAVHNYEMLHRVYPPGTINPTGPIQALPQGYHHNWLVQLLPFVEEKNTAAHVDRSVGVYHTNNMPIRRLSIPIFNCPSMPKAQRGYSDYAAVHNDVEAPIDTTNNGVFFLNSRIRYFDLKDGSSNTLFFGEKITFAGDLGWMSGTRATLRNTGVRINASQGNMWRAQTNASYPVGYPPGVESDDLPTETKLSDEDTLNTLLGDEQQRLSHYINWWSPEIVYTYPTDSEEDEYGMSGGMSGMSMSSSELKAVGEERAALKLALSTICKTPETVVGGFGSFHPGGAQFAMGDGSVRFLGETIDDTTLLQLGHRADGRLTGDSW